MSLFEAILLGLIQGITEFFPISSSAHLLIAEQLLGIETDYSLFFNVFIQHQFFCSHIFHLLKHDFLL